MVPLMKEFDRQVIHRHWLPILTFCPVNNLPDLIYVEMVFSNQPVMELYGLRKKIRKMCSMKKAFMEDIADVLAEQFPTAYSITVSLAFQRHEVTVFPTGATENS